MNYFTIFILPTFFVTIYGDWENDYSNHVAWKHLPEDCGRSRYDDDGDEIKTYRIINGDRAKLGEFPWMGRLGLYLSNGQLHFFCGAVLINRFYLISAAHCEEKANFVRLGEHDAEKDIDCDKTGVCAPPPQDIKIAKYYFEDFCRTLLNDLMVLELEKPAVLNEFVQPVCLPRRPLEYEDIVGNFLTLPGWGSTTGDVPTASRYLLQIALKVQNVTTCKKMFRNFYVPGQFCSEVTETEQIVCRGDSGGPGFMSMEVDGVSRAYAFGIVSYAIVNCKQGAAFTNILHYMETILGVIKKS